MIMGLFVLPSGVEVAIEFEPRKSWPFLPHVKDQLDIQLAMRSIGAVESSEEHQPEVVCCCGAEHEVFGDPDRPDVA